jgi:hypothetical protein
LKYSAIPQSPYSAFPHFRTMTKRFTLTLLLLALLLIAAGPAAAQDNAPVTAILNAASGELTVGDPVGLTLAVTHPAGYQVIAPALAPTWGDFTVVTQGTPATRANGDGTETTSIAIDARLFKPGAFETPSLDVTVTDGKGGLRTVTAAPVAVTIDSVLAAGDTELRDIKPQATLPMPAVWPWIAAGAALVAALAAAIVFGSKHRSRAAVDNRLPHERALDTLAAIEAMRLPEQGRFKEHTTRVSDTVRIYVEQRFAIPALERTTREIQADLRTVDTSPEVKALLVAFLQESDLIKFSEFLPDLASASELVARGRAIVEATQPVVLVEMDDSHTPSKPWRKGRRAQPQLAQTETPA